MSNTLKKYECSLTQAVRSWFYSSEKEELIEITAPEGEIIMKVRMTDDGPVISVSGAHLELKSTETIALEAKKIKIKAEEKVASCAGRIKPPV